MAKVLAQLRLRFGVVTGAVFEVELAALLGGLPNGDMLLA